MAPVPRLPARVEPSGDSMSKRPVQRQASRPTGADIVPGMGRQPLPGVHADRLSGADAIMETPEPVPSAGGPTSRAELAGMLDELRERGDLGVADEAAILREYDGLAVELRA